MKDATLVLGEWTLDDLESCPMGAQFEDHEDPPGGRQEFTFTRVEGGWRRLNALHDQKTITSDALLRHWGAADSDCRYHLVAGSVPVRKKPAPGAPRTIPCQSCGRMVPVPEYPPAPTSVRVGLFVPLLDFFAALRDPAHHAPGCDRARGAR